MCKNTFLMNRDAKQNVDVPKFNLEWNKNKISVYLSDLINFFNIFFIFNFQIYLISEGSHEWLSKTKVGSEIDLIIFYKKKGLTCWVGLGTFQLFLSPAP